MPKPDIIIVGAGSAGCIQARELAARGLAVTLIEPAGSPCGESKPATTADRQRPSHWLNLLGTGDDWDFQTQKVKSLAGRTLQWPRGRGLGGCSRINAMIWFPPTKSDFRMLAESVSATPQAMKAAFAAVESLIKPESPKWLSSSAMKFFAAAADLPGNEMIYQRVNRDGRRFNPADLLQDTDFLQNATVEIIRATVDRVVFSADKAVGVMTADGETISCTQSVVLSAGAIATPMILMRSGIGPRDVLTQCGIDVRQDAPNVGANLQDHLIMPVVFGVEPKHAFSPEVSDGDVRCWETVGGGPVASNIAEAGGLFLDDQIQIHVTPTHYLTYPDPKTVPAMTIGVNVTQPESRGRLMISSADPNAPPMIEPNYLSVENDLNKTIQGVRLAREIAQHNLLANFTTGELLPGKKRESDKSIAKSIARFCQTLYHPVGTVGDVDLAAENLSVVDASVLKRITVGNPNASVMTMAHCRAQA